MKTSFDAGLCLLWQMQRILWLTFWPLFHRVLQKVWSVLPLIIVSKVFWPCSPCDKVSNVQVSWDPPPVLDRGGFLDLWSFAAKTAPQVSAFTGSALWSNGVSFALDSASPSEVDHSSIALVTSIRQGYSPRFSNPIDWCEASVEGDLATTYVFLKQQDSFFPQFFRQVCPKGLWSELCLQLPEMPF